jgi:hypothetical protein
MRMSKSPDKSLVTSAARPKLPPVSDMFLSSTSLAYSNSDVTSKRKPEAKQAKKKKTKRTDVDLDPFTFINQLARGENAIEFVYLVTIENRGSAKYNPYQLKIVPHAEIDPDDFFTLSASGITHFVGGAAGNIL